MQGIILENISNLYNVKAEGIIYESVARGKFKQEGETPLVGDIVEIDIIDKINKKAIINKIMPRKTIIKRPKIANIDQMILVVSTKDPKPDLLMLDKQLAYLEYLKINSIIVINKIDLNNNYEEIKKLYTNVGYKVILANAKSNIGIDEIKEILKGKISAFSGNSGVGKSTIINAIFGKNTTLEGEISKKNKKGKNTTTVTKLYETDKNSFIADTPGFANFDILEIESNKLENYFIEFKPYIQKCEFVGCSHIKEENCAIKDAMNLGKISKERYEKFCKIYIELKSKEAKKW